MAAPWRRKRSFAEFFKVVVIISTLDVLKVSSDTPRTTSGRTRKLGVAIHTRQPSLDESLLVSSPINVLSEKEDSSANDKKDAEIDDDQDESGPTGDSPYNYVPITALDKYGKSVQLQNAKQAASRQGALLIAALYFGCEGDKLDDCGVVVCSLRRHVKGLKKQSVNKNGNVHVITTPLSLPISDGPAGANEDFRSSSSMTAIAYSGIVADGLLLTSALRDYYIRRVWDRYGDAVDPQISSVDVADKLRSILLSFMRYDVSREISDGAGPVVLPRQDDDDDDDVEDDHSTISNMARPFGVQSLVFGIHKTARKEGEADISVDPIVSVTPSGESESYVVTAIGCHSQQAQELMQKRWRAAQTKEEVVLLCVDVIRECIAGNAAAGTDADATPNSNAVEDEIVCEVLSSQHGLHIHSVVPAKAS